MSIEKVKLLGIKGNSKDLDRFLANVLFSSDVQIEDAKKIYNKSWKLEYFEYDYRIKETLKNCENLLNKLEIQYTKETDLVLLENKIPEIADKINQINSEFEECKKTIVENENENELDIEKIKNVSRILDIDIDMEKIYDLKYIKFRYGSIPKKNLEEIKKELDSLNLILYEIKDDGENSWILYFTTTEFVSEVDGIFNIQKFERELFPEDLVKKPKEYIKDKENQIDRRNALIQEMKLKIESLKKETMTVGLRMYRELQTYDKINTIKKYIVHDQNGGFYVVAWIPETKLKAMEKVLDRLPDIDYVVKSGENPPTKLKNNKFIKPFEELVKMYGMPKVDEIDPTWFVTISVFIMFGFMFGDVGHGLIFFILGIILLIKKKKTYGTILSAGGLSAIIFGFLYGSVFGKEDIVKPILISPMNNINTMLIYGIAVGTILIIIAMTLNIVNGIKNKDIKKIFLDKNGLAGITLYMFVLICVSYYFLKGKMLISINAIIAISLILIFIIMFNDKIMGWIEKKKDEANTSIVEKIFEIIEMLLSFLSNTISFLRLAAFAINHAGLCMAVYLLANMTTGAGNILIAIIGNVVVLVLEGLIVGIQTLRLEYYELFSRFYDGSGKEYKSIKKQMEEF